MVRQISAYPVQAIRFHFHSTWYRNVIVTVDYSLNIYLTNSDKQI